jgi:hypothetical protein
MLRRFVAEPETLVATLAVVADQCFARIVMTAFAVRGRHAFDIRVM